MLVSNKTATARGGLSNTVLILAWIEVKLGFSIFFSLLKAEYPQDSTYQLKFFSTPGIISYLQW